MNAQIYRCSCLVRKWCNSTSYGSLVHLLLNIKHCTTKVCVCLVFTLHGQKGLAGSERSATQCLDQLCHLQTNRRLDYSIDWRCFLKTQGSFAHWHSSVCLLGTVGENAFSDSVFVHQNSHSDDDVIQLVIDKGLISLYVCV